MKDQTKETLKEMLSQLIAENGITEFLWIVSQAIEKNSEDYHHPVAKTIFYHCHASDFFFNRTKALK